MFAQELIVNADKPAIVNRLARMLAVNNINTRAITLFPCDGQKAMHLVTDNHEKAAGICDEQGIPFKESLILALTVGDVPGGLAGILDTFEEEGIIIDYLYTSIAIPGDGAVVLIRPEDFTATQQVVERRGLRYLNRI